MVTLGDLCARLLAGRDRAVNRPWIIAVDGRGRSGKSTLVDRLLAKIALDAEVIHTDDVAWHHSFFGWDDLLAEQILTPAQQRRPVCFVPPPWRERGRPGAITVSANCPRGPPPF